MKDYEIDKKYRELLGDITAIFKARDNPDWVGAVTGEVMAPPPAIEVKLFNDIVVKANKIIICEEKKAGYLREFALTGEITEYSFQNTTNTEVASNHSHPIKSLAGKGTFSAEGEIRWTDELKKGDKVLMLPTNGHELYYLIDKVVKM